ncbi:4Fe-4S binding protein [Lutibacter sp. B2]|nr:4Fe-4S binding protein [Lutibacter sp. B2]
MELGKFKRKIVQIITALVTNANFKGFFEGKIYKGSLKKSCVPGLNCYSCPGAVGSCPIGSLQAVIGGFKYKMSFYIVGMMMLMGTLLGRFICGWLCPFGLIQELLNKIPSPKIKIPKIFSYIKYVVLIIFVILLPIVFVNDLGMGDPTFCKYICPAGTLEGGIPLVLTNPPLRDSIGNLFFWKIFLLIGTIIMSIITFRPFCKAVCPLGAIYALLNPISVYRYEIDKNKCISCGLCAKTCKLDVEVYKKPNSLECIRCGECISICPQNAIERKMNLRSK